jgi:hypothetical protein
MIRHPEYIAFGKVLAFFGSSSLRAENPLQVSKKQVARLEHMVHRFQNGTAILTGWKVTFIWITGSKHDIACPHNGQRTLLQKIVLVKMAPEHGVGQSR